MEAIEKQTLAPHLLVVVNNNSSDGTMEYLDSLADTEIKVIHSLSNIGHGAALALGLDYVMGIEEISYVSFMEDDSIPQPELMQMMFGKLVGSNFKILCLDGFRIKLGRRVRPILSEDKITEVDFALLDGVVMEKSMLKKVGPPKRDFFMMCDDLEFSKRIKKHGFRIGCIKTKLHEILHLGGGSKFSRSTLWRGYYQARNNVHILKEYFSPEELMDFVTLEGKRTLGALKAPDRVERISLRMLGVLHGVIGRKGRTIDPGKYAR